MTPDRSRSPVGLAAAPVGRVGLAAAVDAFLSQPDLAPGTRAKYRQTLAVVEDELGDAPVTGASLAGVIAQRWYGASPATWNRHLATVRSLARYCLRTGLLEIDGEFGLQRRAETHDHTRSIPLATLERLWERRDIDLRERTLWRLLYETAARAEEVLRLDVEDLDVLGKRARVRSKGGDTDWLFFGSGSARLLPQRPHPLHRRPARRRLRREVNALRPPVLPPRRRGRRRIRAGPRSALAADDGRRSRLQRRKRPENPNSGSSAPSGPARQRMSGKGHSRTCQGRGPTPDALPPSRGSAGAPTAAWDESEQSPGRGPRESARSCHSTMAAPLSPRSDTPD